MRNFIILIFFFSFSIHSHLFEINNVVVKHPLLKVNSEKSKTGAGYFKILNNSNNEIILKEIKSSISETTEIHEVIEENGIYKMRPVKDNLVIMPGEQLVLKPKSYHIMFYNINRKLINKEMLDARLIFNKDLEIAIKFKTIVGQKLEKHH